MSISSLKATSIGIIPPGQCTRVEAIEHDDADEGVRPNITTYSGSVSGQEPVEGRYVLANASPTLVEQSAHHYGDHDVYNGLGDSSRIPEPLNEFSVRYP